MKIRGEWTLLKYLYDERPPEEERISLVRAVKSENLWNGFDIEEGYRPFSRFPKCQTTEYLSLNGELDQLIIAGVNYSFDTPGNFWLAFNPAVARILNWSPMNGSWFRWANQEGDLVSESIWWNDGPIHQHSNGYLNCEVGTGWLVLVTKQGFEEIRQWAGQLARGGLIRRRLGLYGRSGSGETTGVLPIL